jgi:DNA-binding transcriptional regulator YiaG
LYGEGKGHIHLLFLFDKDGQEDLNPTQRTFLRQSGERRKGPQEKTLAKKIKLRVFVDLRSTLQGARASERGRYAVLRVTELPAPPRKLRPREICQIRRSLNASQVLFACFLNVSRNTIRSWEQGTRRPQGADLKLLAIAERNPQAILKA